MVPIVLVLPQIVSTMLCVSMFVVVHADSAWQNSLI